ncbi:tRNA pseudouridine(55) synthase TruB [Eupransor demetentiae]|uniref:tRNA pseudouridine synthase B n=1 Tax=Eupransor demetentiae TaxID=3109584 RepID=A0ABP0EPK3_9LACO|nr:may also work on U342 of tmRNA (TruB) [Lactobacillaceae bacterium LMG 33000]
MSENIDGILVVNKPKGMTSFGVVARLRRVIGQKKIGHAGTLDPNVDGVLVIALGRATKLIDFLQAHPKTYTGEITLGFSTETQDADGEIVERQLLTEAFSAEQIDQSMQALTGDIIQIPPMYSAVKVNGRRLYEYARAGEKVALPERKAHIYEFKRTSDLKLQDGLESFTFEAKVSKGTYIRTLASDLGQKLNWPATMTALTRQAGSGFSLDESTDLDTLMEMDRAEIMKKVVPIADILPWPKKELTQEEWFAVSNGQKISPRQWAPNDAGYLALYYQGELKLVYQFDSERDCWVSRYVFSNQS